MPLWTPADLAVPPPLWFDGQDTARFTESGGVVTAYANKGSVVADWLAGVGFRPVRSATGWDGTLPSSDFTNDALAISWTHTGNRIAVFQVCETSNTSGTNGRLVNLRNATQEGWQSAETCQIYRNATPALSAIRNFTDLIQPGADAKHIAEFIAGASGHSFRLNGGTPVTNATTASFSITQVLLGAENAAPASNPFVGKLPETIILGYEPTTAEQEQIEGYLAHRWGIQANLPSGHTYKAAAPTTGPPLIYLRPDATSTSDGWLRQTGANTLHLSLDEVTPLDTSFIVSPSPPSGQTAKIRLSDPAAGFILGDPVIVSYRYGTDSADPSILTVRLVQGTTTIATWTHNPVPVGFTTVQQTLTAPQLASITNFGDLFLEFSATV